VKPTCQDRSTDAVDPKEVLVAQYPHQQTVWRGYSVTPASILDNLF
jgi:hypothetical protein